MSTTKTLKEILLDIEYYCSRKQTRNAYKAIRLYIDTLLQMTSQLDDMVNYGARISTIHTYLSILMSKLDELNYRDEICKYYRVSNHTCTGQKGAPGTHCNGDTNNCEEV